MAGLGSGRFPNAKGADAGKTANGGMLGSGCFHLRIVSPFESSLEKRRDRTRSRFHVESDADSVSVFLERTGRTCASVRFVDAKASVPQNEPGACGALPVWLMRKHRRSGTNWEHTRR